MTRNYQNGRAKEYRMRQKFMEEGWPIVMRTAGSHGPFDLIAINPEKGFMLLIQCKSSEYEKKKARQELKNFGGDYTVMVAVV